MSGLEPKSKVIGTDTYTVTPLDAWSAYEMLPAVTKLLGPVVGGLAGEKKLEGFGDAIAKALTHTPPAEITALSKKLLSTCLVTTNGKQVDLMSIAAVHFQGRILTMLRVVGFALEVNYADFWQGLQALRGVVAVKLKAAVAEAGELQPSGPAGD